MIGTCWSAGCCRLRLDLAAPAGVPPIRPNKAFRSFRTCFTIAGLHPFEFNTSEQTGNRPGEQGLMTTVNMDPRDQINKQNMTTLQVIVVAITVLLNAMDGYDVLSISFASPGIAAEWGVSSAALGVVLSMELIGMAIGSVLIGGVADKIGRRPTLLGCLLVMASGMILATTAGDAVQLSIWRVYTGLGIGGMLACTNAVVAEFSSDRRRAMCISLMVIGYPLGGTVFGMFASVLLESFNWRAVFYFGA